MNKKAIIIGLAGLAGSGKDTAAAALVEACEFVQYAFAFPLKEAVSTIFGLTHAQVHGDQKEVIDEFWGITPREILQRFGTEAMRNNFGSSIWIDVAERWMKTAPGNAVVISDVRFDDEADFIRSQGGLMIHIKGRASHALGANSAHVSEQGVTPHPTDVVVMNDGTIAQFQKRIIAIGREWVRNV